MGLRHDQGIVLRSYPFGEADRVVVLLSPNHGKLRTVAKGIRKTKSRFGGRLEPFTHVDLVVYEGRNLDTITQVSVIEPHAGARSSLKRVMAAGTLVEVADAVAQEDESAVRLFLLLKRGLGSLNDAASVHPDLVSAFLVQAAGCVGLAPAFDHCASCGATSGLVRFSLAAGGAQCERCRNANSHRLREGVADYMAGLASAELPHLPQANPKFGAEALGIAKRFVEYHLERRLKSLTVLDG